MVAFILVLLVEAEASIWMTIPAAIIIGREITTVDKQNTKTQFSFRSMDIIAYVTVRENRKRNQQWIIQRNWQHLVHKIPDED